MAPVAANGFNRSLVSQGIIAAREDRKLAYAFTERTMALSAFSFINSLAILNRAAAFGQTLAIRANVDIPTGNFRCAGSLAIGVVARRVGGETASRPTAGDEQKQRPEQLN